MRDRYKQISTSHFINETTGEEFKVEQRIALRPDYGIGDCQKRIWTIKKFWVSEVDGVREEDNGKSFEFVYANLDAEHYANQSHLNNLMLMDEDPKYMNWPYNQNERNNLITEWRALREEKFSKNKYLILLT